MTLETHTSEEPRRERLLRAAEQIRLLRNEYPKATNQQIANIYKQNIRGLVICEDDQTEFELFGILDDWLKAHIDNILKGKPVEVKPVAEPKPAAPRRTKTPEEKAEAEAKRRALVEEIRARDEVRIETAIKVRLLEWQTTYGKRLADCTGAECMRLARRYGPFFQEISKRLNASDKVGNHLSEVELQAIAATHKLIGPEALR